MSIFGKEQTKVDKTEETAPIDAKVADAKAEVEKAEPTKVEAKVDAKPVHKRTSGMSHAEKISPPVNKPSDLKKSTQI